MAYMKDSTGRRLDSFPVLSQLRAGNALLGLRPCATRTQLLHARDSQANSQSDGVVTTQTSMTRHYFPDDAVGVRFVYGNSAWWNTLLTNNDITITAAIKLAGVLYQITFDGRTSKLINPLGYAVSDVIAPRIPAGTWLELRTSVTVAAGEKFPATHVVSSADGIADGRFDGSDQTMVGSPSWNGTTNVRVYGPAAIIGQVPRAARPSVLIDGDSITQGAGDTSNPTIPYDRGWAVKAMANEFSYLQGSLYGDSAVNLVPWLRDRGKFAGCTDYVISAMGSNDLYVNSRTAAQLQADVIARWRLYADRGSRVVGVTVPPRTTSTDSWATVANQTISDATKNGHRVTYNNWLRDGAPLDKSTYAAAAIGAPGASVIRAGDPVHPLFGFVDIADLAESARDSGKWSVTAGTPTADGTHPAPAMVTRLAGGINLAAAMPAY
ncbi:SGNH/GDSL hydrolase family protein [Microbacterium sp. 11MF]|uniref:SGNH/GDSL hydrolase family protein n=1 Tax=Microbacterium sp. 11MF TaxID=1169146 RepID=UPI000399BF81|nr:SGNH/GDSL hydrolase family protein [Microbacterium sp. 11MF]